MMVMRKLLLLCFIAFIAFGASSQNPVVLYLDSCFALAKANNAELKMNK